MAGINRTAKSANARLDEVIETPPEQTEPSLVLDAPLDPYGRAEELVAAVHAAWSGAPTTDAGA